MVETTQSSTAITPQTVVTDDAPVSLLSEKSDVEPVPEQTTFQEPSGEAETSLLAVKEDPVVEETVSNSETEPYPVFSVGSTEAYDDVIDIDYDDVYTGLTTVDTKSEIEAVSEEIVYDRDYIKALWQDLKSSYSGKEAKEVFEQTLTDEMQEDWSFSGISFHGIHF